MKRLALMLLIVLAGVAAVFAAKAWNEAEDRRGTCSEFKL